jgi:type II restriction enzyme
MAGMRSEAKTRRAYWVAELAKLSGSFGDDSQKMQDELHTDIAKFGHEALLDHLRTCGAMPESYGHDSSEEKLYSKYTDAILSEALSAIGMKSLIIRERADAADV